MEGALALLGQVGGGFSIFAVVACGWWNADRLLSKRAAEALAGGLTRSASAENAFGAAVELLRSSVAPDLPFLRFLRNVALSSLIGLVIFLIVYFMAEPRFLVQMIEDSFARGRAMRFIVSFGVPTVFVCTFASFFLQGLLVDSLARSSVLGLIGYILFDMLLRLVCFAVVSAAVFALFARYFGSFGGSAGSAIRAVPPTLATGIRFEGIAGVYFYAAMLSAFPLFILLALKLLATCPSLRRAWGGVCYLLPVAEKPLRFCVLLVAATLGLGGAVSGALLNSVTYYVG